MVGFQKAAHHWIPRKMLSIFHSCINALTSTGAEIGALSVSAIFGSSKKDMTDEKCLKFHGQSNGVPILGIGPVCEVLAYTSLRVKLTGTP